MTRGLNRSLLRPRCHPGCARRCAVPLRCEPSDSSTIPRARRSHTHTYRALRHLEARNDQFEKSAWMDVWTEADARLPLSDRRRRRIRLHPLEGVPRRARDRAQMWCAGEPDEGALTPDELCLRGSRRAARRLASLAVKPRRKDMLLVNGTIFLDPTMASWCGIEGRLSKTPSFWTRRVEIVRCYQRIAGIRDAGRARNRRQRAHRRPNRRSA